MSYVNWKDNFRHDVFRKGQDTAGDAVAKHLDNGVKFVVAELPTGVGKSDLAMAFAKTAETAYITTSQNPLIDQYLEEFPGQFSHIKGRGNYDCNDHGTCKDGYDMDCLEAEKEKDVTWRDAVDSGVVTCPYIVARTDAIESPITLTNTAYYALACKNKTLWNTRSLAVLDEAHNLASEILNHVSITINSDDLIRLRISVAFLKAANNKIVTVDEYMPFIFALHKDLEDIISENESGDNLNTDMEKVIDLFDRITRFLNSNTSNWVFHIETRKNGAYCLVGRPVESAPFSQELIFNQANQFVLQSATIINPLQYAKELGIVGVGMFVQRPSPFDLNRRPIMLMRTGKMTKGHIENSLPLIARDVKKILDSRPNQNGIVHTHTYKIWEYLKTLFESDPRCVFTERITRSQDLLSLKNKVGSKVLFSPSMTEGVDGKDDIVRFQILCKVPYPNLGDERIKKKTANNAAWYPYETSKTIIQTIGRGMRTETDWCHNFFLDSDFESFCYNNNLTELTRTFVNDLL